MIAMLRSALGFNENSLLGGMLYILSRETSFSVCWLGDTSWRLPALTPWLGGKTDQKGLVVGHVGDGSRCHK